MGGGRTRGRVGAAALLPLLVASACTRPPDQPAGKSPPAGGSPAPRCAGIGPVSDAPQVTFLSGGKLLAVTPGAGEARCLVDAARAGVLDWSATGDRVLLGQLQAVLPSGTRPPATEPVRSAGWSRPTGKSTVYVSSGGGLFKMPAEGGQPQDISFLARHDEVVYHPAGTHVAAAGVTREGEQGIFLATNTGQNPVALVSVETARRAFGLRFDHSGDVLYYAADHGDHQEMLRLDVATSELATIERGAGRFDRTTVSSFADPTVAYRRGSAPPGAEAVVWRGAG